ncbi:MAG: hypothetical protein ACMUIE_03615 [Thermoplasmatota archaeon]
MSNVKEDCYADHYLYQDHALAESFRIIWSWIDDLKDDVDRKLVDFHDKYKIAIYCRSHFGIFDVKKWDFEHITNEGEKGPKAEIIDEMRCKVIQHLEKNLNRKAKRTFLTDSLLKKA